MPKRYYIAYGSNLNLRQMRNRCPDAKVVGVATLEGWRLLFKGSKTGSYLTIEQQPGFQVPVAVWEVSEHDERNLDRYEGYPTFYYKRELTINFTGIKTGKQRRRRVFVYIMHEDSPIGIPSETYLQTCIEGYQNFGFPLNPLAEAYERCEEVTQWESEY